MFLCLFMFPCLFMFLSFFESVFVVLINIIIKHIKCVVDMLVAVLSTIVANVLLYRIKVLCNNVVLCCII